ncbi:MAG: hypothetical protein PHQ80_02725 [Candidatus ainarchaeum sp.]|nr:hypothetical protein [Candidatus ainarchaeum sp.]MDD5096237.1 hypothetical protein [Candidatus ainarchaeum sp.]
MSDASGKRIELKGSRQEMLDSILANSGGEEFFIKTKPSVKVFALLLDATRAKKVYMNAGIAKTVPEKVMGSLRKSLSVEVLDGKRGRPRKFVETEFLRVLREKGGEVERLATLGMSRRTYYYWKKRLNGHKK